MFITPSVSPRNVLTFYACNISVTMDDFCPSLAIQVSPDPTPAEIIIITVGKRNGIFQVSLGNGEGVFRVFGTFIFFL